MPLRPVMDYGMIMDDDEEKYRSCNKVFTTYRGLRVHQKYAKNYLHYNNAEKLVVRSGGEFL